jgi:hypothetical protein
MASPPSDDGGSATTPGAFTVATEPNSYNSGNNFDYEDKHEDKVYDPSTKPSLAQYLYLLILNNLCLQVSVETSFLPSSAPSVACNHSMLQSSRDLISVSTVSLPKHVMAFLSNPPAHSIAVLLDK